MINETLDRIMLVQLIPDQSTALRMNGIYGANYKLSIVITLFIQAFKYAAEPFFFKHGKNSSKTQIYADVMQVFIVVCLSIFLMVMLNMRLFEQFIGVEFREGLTIVPVLLWANIFLGIYYNLSIWYKLTDQTSKGAYIAIAGAIITVILNYMLIPILGYYGAALSTAICYGTMMVLGYAMGQKYYPIPYKVASFFGYSILALLLYGIGYYLQSNLAQNSTYYLVGNGILVLFILIAVVLEKSKSRLHAENSN
jgi:O-antigen/teichoic acid export membrane protein